MNTSDTAATPTNSVETWFSKPFCWGYRISTADGYEYDSALAVGPRWVAWLVGQMALVSALARR